MASQDLIKRVKQSKIGQAISNLDRDKEKQGFQLIKGGFSGGVDRVKTSLSGGKNAFQPFANVVPATQIALSPRRYIQGQAPGQFAQDASYALRGATQLTPFQWGNMAGITPGSANYKASAPTTNRQKQAQSVGRSIYGLGLTAPIGGASKAVNVARNVAIPTVAGGAINTALTGVGTLLRDRKTPTGQELGEAFKAGAFQGFKQSPLLAVTNPITNKVLSGLGGSFLSNQATQRVVGGFANVIEDELISKLDNLTPTGKERTLSFLLGAVMSGNDELVKGLKGDLQTQGLTPKQADEAVKTVERLRDQRGRFTTDAQDTRIPTAGGGFLGESTELRPRPDGTGLERLQLARSRLGSQGGFIDFGAKVERPKLRTETEQIIKEARGEIGSIKDEPKTSIRKQADDFYTQWVNRYAPVEKASRVAKKKLKTQGASLRPENDPEYLVRRFTGAGGIANQRFNNVLKPIVDELDSRGIDKVDMDAYLKAKRDIGLAERNIFGSDSNLASKRVVALMEKYPGIEDVAQKLYKYQNEGFQEMIDAGFLSKEAGDLIRQQNPDYVPFQRVMDELDNYLGVPSTKLQQGTQPIQKIKGSTKQIYSPIESVIANTFKQRAAIEKNRVAKSIVDLQKIAPDLGFEQMKKSTPETITVWRNGQKEYWKVGSDIADTAKGVDEESMNTLLKIFKAPASLLRQGATGRNPDFLIPNIIKDQFDAGISSKYGYIPFIDYVSGLKSMLANDDVYQKWANSGAKIDLGELSGRKSIQKSFDSATKKKGLLGWLGSGLDVLGKYSEEPTRVGLFKKAYKKTGNELIAALESRDATVDFARMGSKMKTANSVIPFLNVGIQGFDKIMRQAKDNPGKLAFNAGIYAAIPAITTTLYNLANHAQEYSEIPQYVKDSNFVLVSGRNDDGTVDYFTIPKGNIVPLIANPIENFLSYTAGQNDQSLAEFTTQFISSALPVVGDGSSLKEVGVKTIGQNLPQLLKPPTESLLNKSFYKYDPNKEEAKEIVPFYLKDREAYQQAYEWTPKTYKAIGAALNVSPLQVQHLMESYLAGYTKVPSQIIGILDNVANKKEVRKNDVPILRRFMSTTFPSSGIKPVDKGETDGPGFFERITGKTQAKEIDENQIITQQLRDNIKERIKYGNEVSESELRAAYLQNVIQMPSSNRYEKGQKDSKLWTKSGEIIGDENLSDAQKSSLLRKIGTELGVEREDIEKYQVAKQDNNQKTLHVLDQFDTFQNPQEMMQFLVQGRKPVNGKILVSDGVIDNLVNDGLIPPELGKELKKLDINNDGTLKRKKSSGGTSGKSTYQKALEKYLDNLSKISLPSGKIKTQSPVKINVKGLTFGE